MKSLLGILGVLLVQNGFAQMRSSQDRDVFQRLHSLEARVDRLEQNQGNDNRLSYYCTSPVKWRAQYNYELVEVVDHVSSSSPKSSKLEAIDEIRRTCKAMAAQKSLEQEKNGNGGDHYFCADEDIICEEIKQ